jgi:GH24 family phage-related lysozyme (muramidase)
VGSKAGTWQESKILCNGVETMIMTEKAKRLILSFEGLDQPYKWPRGDSGISIGRGYDLGYVTPSEFAADWADYLPAETIERLKKVCGLKGESARRVATRFADIWITPESADAVFERNMLPKQMWRTIIAFPGVEELPADAQGALVSLVYNRGTAMEGDRRMEMRTIRDAVKFGDLVTIAKQLRSMKRLWIGKGLDGLLRRRDAEAALVESCIQ